jgi:HK97 family phage major capsid protein
MENFDEQMQSLVKELRSTQEANELKRDTLLEEKLTRLNDAISDAETKAREIETAAGRPSIGATGVNEDEAKSAFLNFARSGNDAEIKAMSASVPAEGGITVPKVIANSIQSLLIDISPIRQIANVVSTTTPDLHIPFNAGGTASVWTGEKTARTETAAPSMVDVAIPFGELSAMPLVTQQLLEDSYFDIEAFLQGEVATEFARAEGAAFVNGTGVSQPKGFLSYTTAATADTARAFGTIQHLATGGAGTAPTADHLTALIFLLKAGYRAGSVFVMSRAMLGSVRGLKDSTGRFLWEQSMQAGTPSTLLGYPVYEAEDMPAVGTNAYPVAFGNFKAGYTIADRVGLSVLRDPYSNKPYVSFYTRKRLGGAVVDSSAIKLIKCSA